MARVSAALFVVGVAHAAGSRVHMSQHRMRVRGGARALMSETPLPPPPMPAPPPAPVPVKLPPVSEGANAAGLKTITLTHANGDSATLYTFGGCVTSYTHAGVETLKVRPDAKMDGSKPISGGIPHCFPQFGPGAIQQHGFARNLEWEVRSTDAGAEPSVCLRLADSPKTRDMWPYPFEAIYTVTLASDRLKTSLEVKNTGAEPFTFTAALHSYFDISAVANLKIEGNFKGSQYIDKTAKPPAELTAASDTITISKETDSVYKGVSGELKLVDSGKGTQLAIECKQGWRDTVIWNPYGDQGMGYDSFVCAEAALAAFPFTLQPNVVWTGLMDLVSTKL
ncbi:hypothetical protein KFE25_010376 [Diacronema lutheri]|uniref:glucose-6-phosphate 1-epimerase n=2 Tax=Diacronema lutheri TaxID=2081491 RepID=A0A8J5X729_DIALT|nr:hypothetical protein KFE25_010376 [Diacronema lutheri]